MSEMCDLLTIFKNKFRKIENLTKKCVNLEGYIYIYIYIYMGHYMGELFTPLCFNIISEMQYLFKMYCC